MTKVVLGNRNAVHSTDNGASLTAMPKGKRATTVELADDTSLGEALTIITGPRGVWASHATEGSKPAWVASDSSGLASVLSEHFGGIEIRDLEESE